MIPFIVGVVIGALLVLGALWKSGFLERTLASAAMPIGEGLEFLKLPEKIMPGGKDVRGVELIHFKGKNGLELLVAPKLAEVKKKREKEISINPAVSILTGSNLTGYFLMLTKMLFLLEKHPVFLVVKERDIERFKRHSNISISIFRQKSQMSEEIKMLKYQFHKGIINESEFKKKIMKIGLQAVKSQLKEPLYDGYKYFSNPGEILRDLHGFLLKAKDGIVVATILDEMMEKNPKKSRMFLDEMVKLCMHHSTPLILTSEQGVFGGNVNNLMKSYCDMVLETSLKSGRRYVTTYSFEKVFPGSRVSDALKDYKKFLKKVGFLKEK